MKKEKKKDTVFVLIMTPIPCYSTHKKFGLEFCSGEVTRRRPKQVMSFLHAVLLLDLIYVPTNYYQNYLKQYGSYGPAEDFGFRGYKYITKKVRVVSLACNMPTGPPFHSYQILSKYLQGYQSYGAHMDASSYVTQQQKLSQKRSITSAKIWQIITNIELDLDFTMIYPSANFQ